MSKSWIGVDFDGTLAEYHGGPLFPPGKPIPKMVERVQKWLAEGKQVCIMTARMSPLNHNKELLAEHRRALEMWCIRQFGKILPLTHMKDYLMEELWDDRAIQVIPNTGERADGKP